MTAGEQDAHDSKRDNRSMLLEGGSVRGMAHTPPKSLHYLTVSEADFRFPTGSKTEESRVDHKHCSLSKGLHNLPVFAPGFWIVGALFSVRTHGHVALVLMVGGEHSTESESMRFRSSSGL